MTCEVHRGIGHLVGHELHDLGGIADAFLEALEVVLAVVVVLHQHADLGVLDVGQRVLGIDHALGVVIGLEAHRPRELLGLAPLRRAGRHVEMRHLLLVDVFVDRRVGRCAQRVEQAEHLVLLDELARHLDRLGRRVAVIERDEVDLAAVDAAGVVDHLPEDLVSLADHAIGRRRTAVWAEMTDLDLGIARPVVVLLLSRRRTRRRKQSSGRRAAYETTPTGNQRSLLRLYLCRKVRLKIPA